MTALAKTRMTVDEYLAWAVGRPGRYELFGGEVYAMAPETSGHAETKYAVQFGAIGRNPAPATSLSYVAGRHDRQDR